MAACCWLPLQIVYEYCTVVVLWCWSFRRQNEVIQPSLTASSSPASMPCRDDPISLGLFFDVDEGAAAVGQVV